MNQLNKIIEITKETVKKSSSYRPISSLEEDFEKYEKRGFIEAISTKVSKEETACLLYTSPSPRDGLLSRMPSSA